MDPLALLALTAALLPGLAGFLVPRVCGLTARAAPQAAAAGALGALALALACAWGLAAHGPQSAAVLWLELPGSGRVSLGAQVDGLSVLLLLTVSLIGSVVSRYAVRHLDGHPGQARFSAWLAYTLSAVLLLVVSSNLVMFFLGWVATSHGIHRLLTFRSERPAALLAARKKFLISRLGDLFLLLAFVLVYRRFGSFEFAEIFPRAGELTPGDPTALWVGVLLVLGAMTKSAQFPFHTWLPDTMEAPTPVSALMHAGIINAGGFLLIRMSPLLAAAPGALVPLALGGAFTALFGSLVMLTQSDVKRKYAWSTVAQMGFMMLQCGLGAFAAATLHLVGHAFYKGHAFLAAGSVVAPDASSRPTPAPRPVAAGAALLALLAGSALVAGLVAALGLDAAAKPGLTVLSGVLALASAQLLLLAGPRPAAWLPALGFAAAVGLAYFGGVALFERILAGAIPTAVSGALAPLVSVGIVVLFLAVFALQARSGSDGRAWRPLWVHASSGFYLGTLQDRLVQAIWPVRPAPALETRPGGPLS